MNQPLDAGEVMADQDLLGHHQLRAIQQWFRHVELQLRIRRAGFESWQL
jgi:hypothetical protein